MREASDIVFAGMFAIHERYELPELSVSRSTRSRIGTSDDRRVAARPRSQRIRRHDQCHSLSAPPGSSNNSRRPKHRIVVAEVWLTDEIPMEVEKRAALLAVRESWLERDRVPP